MITVAGKKAHRGRHITKDTRYRIVAVTGRKREFAATLIKTINIGGVRLAIFKVRKDAE